MRFGPIDAIIVIIWMFFSIISFIVRTIIMVFISICLLDHIFPIILIFIYPDWTYKLLRFWCSLCWS